MAGGKSTRLNPIVASHRLRAGATFSISLAAALSKGPVPVSSIVIASVATLLMLAGSALGVYLNHRVPNEHLNEATKDIVKLATGIIATIAGLVLSLLIATAKNSYDAVSTDVKSASADFIMMDRALAELGDKARAPREKLRQTIDIAVKTQLSLASNAVDAADPLGPLVRNHEAMQKDIRALVTTSSGEEWLQQRADLVRRSRPGAVDAASGRDRHSARGLHCGRHALACDHFRQFWPVYPRQSNGHRGFGRGRCVDLSVPFPH